MTLSEAIKIARGRVAIVPQGPLQWVVNTWVPRQNATYQSMSMDIWNARRAAKAERIREALLLLGISREDAECEVHHLADHYGQWDVIVRKWYRKKF